MGVVIPYFRGERYWAPLVDSLRRQTRLLDEAVIVLDGPDENLPDRDLSGTAHRVILVQHRGNLGVAAARNTGISASSTDYLFFLDQDDFWYPDRVALFAEAAAGGGPLIAGRYDLTDSEGAVLRREIPARWLKAEERQRRLDRQFRFPARGLAIASVCCRREGIPPFDSALGSCDDYLFLFDLLARSPAALVDRSTGGRRIHEGNTSRGREHIASRIRAVSTVRKHFTLDRRSQRRGVSNLCVSRAVEHLQAGDVRRAAASFSRATTIDPGNIRALSGKIACRLSKDPVSLINGARGFLFRVGLGEGERLVSADTGPREGK